MINAGVWDYRAKGYVVPSFLTDPPIMKLGQQLDIEFNTGVPPIQIASYLVFSRYRYLLYLNLAGAVFRFLIKYQWGLNLILKYPRLFSFGNYHIKYAHIGCDISYLHFVFH